MRSLFLQLERYPKRMFLLLSSILVSLLYGRSFTSPFVYDDLDQIVSNPNLASWSIFVQRFLFHPVELTTHFLGYGGTTYRPVFWFSLFSDRVLWGLNPGGFHATNVFLHALNGNLLFLLLRRLNASVASAVLVSVLWLVLPVNTEVVAWVSGRAYLLCTTFIMLSILIALRYIERSGLMLGIACFVTTACAVLSHELGIVILPLLLVITLLEKQTSLRNLLRATGIVSVAIAGIAFLRFCIGVKTFSSFASAKVAGLVFWQYFSLILLPLHMSVERSTSISLSQWNRWLFLKLSCVVLAFSCAIICRRRTPTLLFGLVWFTVCIAPFCLITNYQGMAERFAYLGAIGIVLVVVALCSAMRSPAARNLLMVCVAVWFGWSVYRTYVRVEDWSDPVRLYRSSLQATPLSATIHYNLAFSLREQGDLHDALNEYERVLAINSMYPHAYASVGDVYLKMNLYVAAQEAYKHALEQSPDDAAVLLNSGAASQGLGEFSEAESAYLHVSQIDPASSSAHVNLGVLYLSENKTNEAIHEFAKAIDLKSKDVVPYYDLGVLFQQDGRGDLALVLYKKALEIKPNDEDTLRNIQTLRGAIDVR